MYSDALAEVIDQEVKTLVDSAMTTTRELLGKHQDDLRKVGGGVSAGGVFLLQWWVT